MYPDVSYVYPECILDSFEIRVKYMQNVKIHVFSWNLTEHVRYVWDTSRYIRIRVSCRIHAGYIRIRILITNPPKLDNKPPRTQLDGVQRGNTRNALPHNLGSRRDEESRFVRCSPEIASVVIEVC